MAQREKTPEELERLEQKVRQTEIAISWVLRIGVVLSVIIVTIGLVIIFIHHPGYAKITGGVSYHTVAGKTALFPHTFGGIIKYLRAGKNGEGRGIVVMGLIVLLLTPILRVVTGVVSFIYEDDPPMAIVTAFVLFVLIMSFVLSGA
jgi:uncharacterized membrane protein